RPRLSPMDASDHPRHQRRLSFPRGLVDLASLLNGLRVAEASVASAEHLHLAVKDHEVGLHPELRVTLADLLAEFRVRRPVRLGLCLRRCHFGLAISDLGGAAIAMVDGDDLPDAVQLDGRGEIVPKCLVPVLERRGDDADRRACDDELLNLPVRFCSTVYRCTGSCMRGSMQAKTMASYSPSAACATSGAKARAAPPIPMARRNSRRWNMAVIPLQHAQKASCNFAIVPLFRWR